MNLKHNNESLQNLIRCLCPLSLGVLGEKEQLQVLEGSLKPSGKFILNTLNTYLVSHFKDPLEYFNVIFET